MVDIQAFITQYNGHSDIGDTTENRGECVGLAEVWGDANGWPHIWGNACDMPAAADRNAYDIIPNSDTYVPPVGSLAVFPAGWGGSAVGHVSIVAPGTNVNALVVFEQNDRAGGGNGSCRVHSFAYPAGTVFIVPKNLTAGRGAAPQVQEVNEMVTDENHLQALFVAFRGRNAGPAEVAQFVGKVSFARMIEMLNEGDERNATAHAFSVGQIAVRDNWEGQIHTLQSQKGDVETKLAADEAELHANTTALKPPALPKDGEPHIHYVAYPNTQPLEITGDVVQYEMPSMDSTAHAGVTPDGDLHAGNVITITGATNAQDPFSDGRSEWLRTIWGQWIWPYNGTNANIEAAPVIETTPEPAAPTHDTAPAEDLPAGVSDYELATDKKITSIDVFAVDAAGKGKRKFVPAGTPVTIGATLKLRGDLAVRTSTGVRNKTWYVIPMAAFTEHATSSDIAVAAIKTSNGAPTGEKTVDSIKAAVHSAQTFECEAIQATHDLEQHFGVSAVEGGAKLAKTLTSLFSRKGNK